MITSNHWARLSGLLLETGCDPALDLPGRERFIVETALAEVLSALRRVGMRIDYARQHDPAAEIHFSSTGANERADGLIRPDGRDGITAHRHRLHDAAACIFGMDLAVEKHEVSRHRCGGGKIEQGRQENAQNTSRHQQPPIISASPYRPQSP